MCVCVHKYDMIIIEMFLTASTPFIVIVLFIICQLVLVMWHKQTGYFNSFYPDVWVGVSATFLL